MATFILSEIKASVELKRGNVRALEAMAVSQIAVASALIAVFGGFHRYLSAPWVFGFVWLALAVCTNGITLWPVKERLPSPEVFSFGPTLRDIRNKEKIVAMLGEAWADYSTELRNIMQRKIRAIIVGWVLVFLGVTFLGIGILEVKLPLDKFQQRSYTLYTK